MKPPRKIRKARADAKRMQFANLHALFSAMTHQDSSESLQKELAKLTPDEFHLFKQGVAQYKIKRMLS